MDSSDLALLGPELTADYLWSRAVVDQMDGSDLWSRLLMATATSQWPDLQALLADELPLLQQLVTHPTWGQRFVARLHSLSRDLRDLPLHQPLPPNAN